MSYIDQFKLAIIAGDETEAEKLSYHLQAADEVLLIALLDPTQRDAVDHAKTHAADLRWWAVRALAHCGTAKAAPMLATFLSDPDANVGLDVEQNATSVSADEANLLCATAALAFGHLHQREPEAVQPYLFKLADQLAHADGFVRQAASDSLALCGDTAVPALEKALASTNDGARSRAAHALRKIGSLAVAPALFQHLNDPHYLVRLHAYEGLDAMGLLDNVILSV